MPLYYRIANMRLITHSDNEYLISVDSLNNLLNRLYDSSLTTDDFMTSISGLNGFNESISYTDPDANGNEGPWLEFGAKLGMDDIIKNLYDDSSYDLIEDYILSNCMSYEYEALDKQQEELVKSYWAHDARLFLSRIFNYNYSFSSICGDLNLEVDSRVSITYEDKDLPNEYNCIKLHELFSLFTNKDFIELGDILAKVDNYSLCKWYSHRAPENFDTYVDKFTLNKCEFGDKVLSMLDDKLGDYGISSTFKRVNSHGRRLRYCL